MTTTTATHPTIAAMEPQVQRKNTTATTVEVDQTVAMSLQDEHENNNNNDKPVVPIAMLPQEARQPSIHMPNTTVPAFQVVQPTSTTAATIPGPAAVPPQDAQDPPQTTKIPSTTLQALQNVQLTIAPAPTNLTPMPTDVLVSLEHTLTEQEKHWLGNVTLQHWVRERLPEFVASKNDNDNQHKIIFQLMDRQFMSGGRFLMKDSYGFWQKAGNVQAVLYIEKRLHQAWVELSAQELSCGKYKKRARSSPDSATSKKAKTTVLANQIDSNSKEDEEVTVETTTTTTPSTTPATTNLTPMPTDVLVSLGTYTEQQKHWQGNVTLQHWVRERLPDFFSKNNNDDKHKIVFQLMDRLFMSGGRFLMKDDSNGGWQKAGNVQAALFIEKWLRQASDELWAQESSGGKKRTHSSPDSSEKINAKAKTTVLANHNDSKKDEEVTLATTTTPSTTNEFNVPETVAQPNAAPADKPNNTSATNTEQVHTTTTTTVVKPKPTAFQPVKAPKVQQNRPTTPPPSSFDVVLLTPINNSSDWNAWPGNQMFRWWMNERLPDYANSKTTQEQQDIGQQLLARLEESGGRFLVPSTDENCWRGAGNAEALQYIQQVLQQDVGSIFRKKKKTTKTTKVPGRDEPWFESTEVLPFLYSTPIFSAALCRHVATPSPEPTEQADDATQSNEEETPSFGSSSSPSSSKEGDSQSKEAAANDSPPALPKKDGSSKAPAKPRRPAVAKKPRKTKPAPKKKTAVKPKPPTVKAPTKKAAAAPAVVTHMPIKDPTKPTREIIKKLKISPNSLPKGVTQRPSGKWQAQVYFAGASRYVGVFSSSHNANLAFQAFKEYLQPFKKGAAEGKFTREDLTSLIDQGRKYASQKVGEGDGESNKSK